MEHLPNAGSEDHQEPLYKRAAAAREASNDAALEELQTEADDWANEGLESGKRRVSIDVRQTPESMSEFALAHKLETAVKSAATDAHETEIVQTPEGPVTVERGKLADGVMFEIRTRLDGSIEDAVIINEVGSGGQVTTHEVTSLQSPENPEAHTLMVDGETMKPGDKSVESFIEHIAEQSMNPEVSSQADGSLEGMAASLGSLESQLAQVDKNLEQAGEQLGDVGEKLTKLFELLVELMAELQNRLNEITAETDQAVITERRKELNETIKRYAEKIAHL